MKKAVYKVDTVSVALLKSNPPVLSVTANGLASTPGWRNSELQPRVYVAEPQDGIQDFDFVAEPPTDMVIQVITPISASTDWPAPPSWVKGVRIHAKTNSEEKLISDS